MTDNTTALDPIGSAPAAALKDVATAGMIGLGWYDLTCPFCYLGQARTKFLQARGLTVAELPFQAHRDIPAWGIQVGPRSGRMYERIERDAAMLGLTLNWPARLPNSRIALAAAEWVRRNQTILFREVQERLFSAHFAEGLDIGEIDVVLACAKEMVGDVTSIRASLAAGEAFGWVAESEDLGQQLGVTATPSWLISGELVSGFLPEEDFAGLLPFSGSV